MNMIQDSPITEFDIKLMEWKTTRQCPHKLVIDMVLIPQELHHTQHDVCFYIDIMYINGMPFLTTISKNTKYHTAMWVADCTAPTIASLVESILKLYQWSSFQVKEVWANCKFKPALHTLQDNGWSFMTNFANAHQKAKGHIDIRYCLTDEIIRDYMTKPLHRAKFDNFQQQIMHLPVAAQLMMAAVLH